MVIFEVRSGRALRQVDRATDTKIIVSVACQGIHFLNRRAQGANAACRSASPITGVGIGRIAQVINVKVVKSAAGAEIDTCCRCSLSIGDLKSAKLPVR